MRGVGVRGSRQGWDDCFSINTINSLVVQSLFFVNNPAKSWIQIFVDSHTEGIGRYQNATWTLHCRVTVTF